MTDPERDAIRLVLRLMATAVEHARDSLDHVEQGMAAVTRVLDAAQLTDPPGDEPGH